MTEKEMRDSEVPRIHDIDKLVEYINNLVSQEHDYGTCVYAMSMAAVATFNYVAHILRVSGFQASCADLDILRRTRCMKSGFKVIDFEDLLYPQYINSEYFPTSKQLIQENLEILSKRAQEKINKNPDANIEIIKHWKWLIKLNSQRIKIKKY